MLDSTSTKATNPIVSPALIPSLLGPDVPYIVLAYIKLYGEPRVVSTHHNRRADTRTLSEDPDHEGHPSQNGWSTELGSSSFPQKSKGLWVMNSRTHRQVVSPHIARLNASNCINKHRPNHQVVASSGLDHTTRYERPLAMSLLDSRTPHRTCTI